MIVLDASVVVDLLGDTSDARLIAARLAGESLLTAPHLLDIEVLSAIRSQRAAGALSDKRAEQCIVAFRHMPITRQGHLPLLERIWTLRHRFTAYDACYLALTETLDATLLTRDRKLSTANLGRGQVEII